MKKIYVITADATERVTCAFQRLCIILSKNNAEAVMGEHQKHMYEKLDMDNVRYINEKDTEEIMECLCILSIGGDGTLLRAASTAAAHNLPLVGINAGKVGYLAKIPETVPEDIIEKVLDGSFLEVRHMTLDTYWERGNIQTTLNDITLSHVYSGQMCTFQIYCGEEQVALWRADGIIIFTPTGSTAYAYSAGGPAIEPGLHMIGIMPICPQNGRRNALICRCDREITIVSTGDRIRISADGKTAGYLMKGDRLSIIRGEKDIRFLQTDNQWRIKALNRVLNNWEEHMEVQGIV